MRRPTPPLPQASVDFRTALVDGMLRVNGEAFWYIDQDTVAGECPLCGGTLSVYFAGRAPRADLLCRLGCDEQAVGDALVRGVA